MTTNEIWAGDSRVLAHDLPTPIHAIVTDPPYGCNYKSNMSTTQTGNKYSEKLAGDGDLDTALKLFYDSMLPIMPKLADEADVYCFARWDLAHMFSKVLEKLELKVKMQLVWNKGSPGIGDLVANWGCGYEVILYAKKGRRPIAYRRGGVIEVEYVSHHHMSHPSEKPVPLLAKLIEMSTNPGDLVVDPFSGSGSTSVAAQQLGRNSIGIEIADQYIERSRTRLEQVTLI